jgi:hypothetical protein
LEKRQGPHQDAQKSSKKTLPFMDDKRTESPLKSGNLKSSRESVMFGCICAFAELAMITKQKTKKFLRFIITNQVGSPGKKSQPGD